MDSEKMLFEKGCFLPSWIDDCETKEEQTPIQRVYDNRNKDLNTLLSELDEINKHIQDVRERQWHLAKMIYFHNNNFA